MILSGKTIFRMTMVVWAAIAFSAAVGCQSESRTRSTESTSSTGGKDDHADAMLNSDTERAKAAMRENRDDTRPHKPAMSGRRDGTRSVDQPRIRP